MALSNEVLLQLRELELNALLETIQAINANASEDDLYKIFKFIMLSNQKRQRMALYVYDEEWECKVFYGMEKPPKPTDEVLAFKDISFANDSLDGFSQFDEIIPIRHKNETLAFVCVGFADSILPEEQEQDFIEALGNIIIVAIENKKLARREAEQRNYRIQLEIAQEVQTLLFPKVLPTSERIHVEASYLPHHRIGGDYYDYLELNPDQFLLCIADVSGKGIPAAILMSNFQAGLRLLARQQLSLTEIVNKLNDLVMLNSQGANFITAFFFIFDWKKQEIKFINAGHNPPFLFLPDGSLQRLEAGTTIVGGFEELPFLEEATIENMKEFLLFAFTDGFTETYNEDGEEFGAEQLQAFLEEHKSLPQEEIHHKLIEILKTFKGGNEYADDITLLSCRIKS